MINYLRSLGQKRFRDDTVYKNEDEKEIYDRMSPEEKAYYDKLNNTGKNLGLRYFMKREKYTEPLSVPKNTDTYKGDKKQRKIDPNEKKFHEILDKVTDRTYRYQMTIVKQIANDIRNNKPDFNIKRDIDTKREKIDAIKNLFNNDKEIKTKLGINKGDVTELKNFMKEKLEIINEFILQNAGDDLNVDDDDDDDDDDEKEGGKRKKHRRSRKKTSHKRKTKKHNKRKTKRRRKTKTKR